MATSSIKGSIFGKVVDDLKKLSQREEEVTRALGERLSVDEVALLGSAIAAANWYSIKTYARMTQILWDFEGNGEIGYLSKRGAESADRLIESGMYAQFDYLSRTQASREEDLDARFAAFGRDLRLLATLSRSILNFSVWSRLPDPEHNYRWMLGVTEARDYPDLLAHTTLGLINRMSERSRGGLSWSWERVSAESLRFRMAGDV